jgi:hypothetical protein
MGGRTSSYMTRRINEHEAHRAMSSPSCNSSNVMIKMSPHGQGYLNSSESSSYSKSYHMGGKKMGAGAHGQQNVHRRRALQPLADSTTHQHKQLSPTPLSSVRRRQAQPLFAPQIPIPVQARVPTSISTSSWKMDMQARGVWFRDLADTPGPNFCDRRDSQVKHLSFLRLQWEDLAQRSPR